MVFCDLVGSTQLSEQLDPEELRDIILAYQAACGDVVGRYDGHVAQHLGDGLLIYFGYPTAHEDDGRRAIHTGLEMVQAVSELNQRLALGDVELAVRVGIYTGVVVTGEVGVAGGEEKLALGQAPNVAARLQGLADPGSVIIGAATGRLAHGFFDFESLGMQTLKGVSEPIEVLRVLRQTGAHNRLEAMAALGLTRAVGRTEEVGALRRHFARALEGSGQTVLVRGEAGIGKSRVVDMFRQSIQGSPHEWQASAGFELLTHSAFHAVRSLIGDVCDFREGESSSERLEKLIASLENHGLDPSVAVPLLAPVLLLPQPEQYPPPPSNPLLLKQGTLENLVGYFLALTAEMPVVLVVEDLHWADPSTLEFLTALASASRSSHLLLVLTARPAFEFPLPDDEALHRITVEHLDPDMVAAMVADISQGKRLPQILVDQIVERTDGVPLFVEELTRAIIESDLLVEEEGHYRLAQSGIDTATLSIPSSLKDSLMARLDRTGEAKETAQLASVFGRSFNYEALHAVHRVPEEVLRNRLARLVSAALVFQDGAPPKSIYLFKHALVQDTAYSSLLRGDRRRLHKRVAQLFVERFPAQVEMNPEVLALHFERAGELSEAATYLQIAGLRALASSAYVEAAVQLRQAVKHLSTLPRSREVASRELESQMALRLPLLATTGYTSVEVEQCYSRALALYLELGKGDETFPLLFSLWGLYVIRASFDEAQVRAEQLRDLAEVSSGADDSGAATAALAATAFFAGDQRRAGPLLVGGAEKFEPGGHFARFSRYADDPLFGSWLNRNWSLTLTGHVDQGWEGQQKAVACAETLANPFEIARSLCYSMTLLHLLGDHAEQIESLSQRVLGLSTEQGIPFWQSSALLWSGWAAANRKSDAGIDSIRHGLAILQAMGAAQLYPVFQVVLGEGYYLLGGYSEGLAVVEECLQTSAANGAKLYDGRALRLQGDLILAAGGSAESAEASYVQAREHSGQQGARLFELEATTALARLLAREGKSTQARPLLEESYGSFTEGSSTRPLREAKQALAELT